MGNTIAQYVVPKRDCFDSKGKIDSGRDVEMASMQQRGLEHNPLDTLVPFAASQAGEWAALFAFPLSSCYRLGIGLL